MFNGREEEEKPETRLGEDRLRTVDYEVVFRRVRCYKCDLTAVYKYRVKQIRRFPELPASKPPIAHPSGHDGGELPPEPQLVPAETGAPPQAVSPAETGRAGVEESPPSLVPEAGPEVAVEAGEPSAFDLESWKSIPRFAEIPETVRCKRCGEVLGLCTECIF